MSRLAAALSRRRGLSVRVLEKTQFPRFSIGESMLPQSLVLLEEAGMLEAVDRARKKKIKPMTVEELRASLGL